MNRNDRIIHNIGIMVIGIFLGVVLAIAAYTGFFGGEQETERENIRITDRQSTMTTNVKAW